MCFVYHFLKIPNSVTLRPSAQRSGRGRLGTPESSEIIRLVPWQLGKLAADIRGLCGFYMGPTNGILKTPHPLLAKLLRLFLGFLGNNFKPTFLFLEFSSSPGMWVKS